MIAVPEFGSVPVLQATFFDLPGEVGPLNVFGNDVTGIFFRAAQIMHRDDSAMIASAHRASLGQISLSIFRLADQPGVRHRGGDQSSQLLLVGQIDKAKAPFPRTFAMR